MKARSLFTTLIKGLLGLALIFLITQFQVWCESQPWYHLI
jgi:hypothetical protein